MSKINIGAGWLSLTLLVVAAVLLGTVGIASSFWNRVAATQPLTVTFLRLAFSAPFMLALGSFGSGTAPERLRKNDWALLLAMGALMAVFQALFFLAIPLAGVTLTVFLSVCSGPLIVSILSSAFFGERLNWSIGLSLLLSVAGAALLVLGGGPVSEPRPGYLLGALLALGSGATYAAYILLSKQVARHNRQRGALVVALPFALSALVLLLVTLPTNTLQLDLPPAAWLIAAYMGLGPTALAYFFIQIALKSATATTAAIIILLEPAVAALLAWALLGEALTPLMCLGGLILIASVLLLSVKSSQPVDIL